MNFYLDRNSSTPLYIQVEGLLRNLVEQPEYKEGKLLPNEVELAKQFAISRATLRQAINQLVQEGLLIRKKGIGTKVSTPVSTKSQNWLSFSQEMNARGMPVKNYHFAISWQLPDKKVANFLEIKGDKKILKLERIRGNKDGPFVFFISYFHPRIGLTGNEDYNRPLYEIIEQDYSISAYLSKEEITAINADHSLAEKLEIQQGDPILLRRRFVYDQGERPIEYNIGYYKADSFIYTVESRRI
ncbi:GntR family transcriptional regulator [Litoribacter alkaliphilus]|uniref:GntR family transcriptional regulator n=1 Tax=Litoribacter ruber TaxID=702568 RepID=A0AAP2CK46_9BACT|nr:GntR family transcriptional regulator [Litoribacter alkaliphilus]MBS9525632.1 GntR family transcriptional regulator [Litoribacter alkaliphilus]